MNVDALKKEAKRLKKESGGEFTHTECLALIARKHGYASWELLIAKTHEGVYAPVENNYGGLFASATRHGNGRH